MFLSTSLVPASSLTTLASSAPPAPVSPSYLVLPSTSYSSVPNLKQMRELAPAYQLNQSSRTDGLLNETLVAPPIHHLPIDLEQRIYYNNSELAFNFSEFNSNLTDNKTLENTIAIVVPILFSLIFIIGLFGNALVVIVVVFNASMRSTTNLLILNLAIADLLFIVFCVPFTASDYYFARWQFGDIWCKIVQYLILVLACSSNYTLVLMSLDRYLAVVHPISSISVRTAKNAYIAIVGCWVFIIAACMPALSVHTTVRYGDNENDTFLSCTFNSTGNITHQQFQLGFMVSSYVIPLLIAFALYFLMLKKLWFGTASTLNYRINNKRCRKRVTRMVIIVVAVFAICWAPIQIILVLKSLNMYRTDQPVNIVIQIASQVLAYMNSCVNPILYSFLSENFRKAFHKVIACNLVGIYGVAGQSSVMQQTGMTSCAQSGAFAPLRTASQMKRNPKQLNDLNNNANDLSPDQQLEINRNLKSVNFNIVADGGLFPHRTDSYKLTASTSVNKLDEESNPVTSGDADAATLNKQIKPILSSKGRFKAQCLDEDAGFENAMELHPTDDQLANSNPPDQMPTMIPMFEFNKNVPSIDDSTSKESAITNDTMNKATPNSASSSPGAAMDVAKNTMTKMSGSNGVFL